MKVKLDHKTAPYLDFETFKKRNIPTLDLNFEIRLLSEVEKAKQIARQPEVQEATAKAVGHYMRYGDLTVLANLVLKEERPNQKVALDVATQMLAQAEMESKLKGKTAKELLVQLDRIIEKMPKVRSAPQQDDTEKTIQVAIRFASSGDTTTIGKYLLSYPMSTRVALIEVAYRAVRKLEDEGKAPLSRLSFRLDKALAAHRRELNFDKFFLEQPDTADPSAPDLIQALGRATWRSVVSGSPTRLRNMFMVLASCRTQEICEYRFEADRRVDAKKQHPF